jgi:hypothetical protein
MDRNSAIVALAAIICGTLIVTTLVTSIVRAVIRRRERAPVDDTVVARLEDRLSRIEQGIDAMSVEVERISEGQRFTTKLLSERQPERLSR